VIVWQIAEEMRKQGISKVLGKNPQTMVVMIDEVETDNWGIGGETVTILRSTSKAFPEKIPQRVVPKG
jgi:4-oxalocrotonate tautomerase family enzyme